MKTPLTQEQKDYFTDAVFVEYDEIQVGAVKGTPTIGRDVTIPAGFRLTAVTPLTIAQTCILFVEGTLTAPENHVTGTVRVLEGGIWEKQLPGVCEVHMEDRSYGTSKPHTLVNPNNYAVSISYYSWTAVQAEPNEASPIGRYLIRAVFTPDAKNPDKVIICSEEFQITPQAKHLTIIPEANRCLVMGGVYGSALPPLPYCVEGLQDSDSLLTEPVITQNARF